MKHAILCLASFVTVNTYANANDAPLPPRVAPAHMTLPEGFKATLFAGEPDLVQPIAMCFDQRGRLWVAECMSYPKWHGDPKQGRDRILIFEDTNNDGVFDKRTVFMDKLANVTALQVGFGGVFVGATPNLLFIPDKNGDDIPDGPPQIVLDGFDIKAGHTVVNGLAWGPDGWLYGCHGIQAVIRVGKPGVPLNERPAMDCGVWRYQPTTRQFEVVADGTTNPWGLDFDKYGQMFITNCVIGHLWHVVPGAHFERMYGQDLNPNIFGQMKMCADHIHWGGGNWTTSRGTKTGPKSEHSEAGGGHAHVGCMVYLGDNLPDHYRNGVFMCNLHGNRINHDILERRGSSYVARHGKDFMLANDSWFRGIALCYGPDGGVFVSDWTDTGECHNYKVVDQTNGRIYKIAYGQPTNPSTTFGKNWDLAKLPDVDLVNLQSHKSDWYGRMARRLLQERAAARTLAKETRHQLLNLLRAAHGPRATEIQLHALWALHVTGGVDPRWIGELLNPQQAEEVRGWTVRLAMETPASWQACKPYLLAAAADGSARVRLELASGLQRLALAERSELAHLLVTHSADADDPYLPLMLWYGIEPLFGDGAAAARLPKSLRLRKSEGDDGFLLRDMKVPLLREYAVRRIAQDSDHHKSWNDLFDMLCDIDEPTFQRDVLRGLDEGLKGRRHVPMPSPWQRAYPILTQSPLAEVRSRALALAVQIGDKRALATLEKTVVDPKQAAVKRQGALDTLLFQQHADLVPVLQSLLADKAMRGPAIKGLARYDNPHTPALILKWYGALNESEKADAVHTLTSRPDYARALLAAIGDKQVPRRDVSAFNARQIQALGNKEITETLAKVWGTIRPASQAKAGLMTKYKAALSAANLKNANLAHGRVLYQKTCAACHRLFGEGGAVGPELTGSQRANLDYILENVLDPSAIVAKDYQVTILTTTSGRVITGIIKQENDKAVTVQTPNEVIVLPRSDIESRQHSPLSIMPEGQLDTLRMDEVRDLIGYLASPSQVALPAGQK